MFAPPQIADKLAWPAAELPYLARVGSPRSFNQGLGGYIFANAARLRLGLDDFWAEECPL